ncbi:hypothetical protein O0L34_g14001 [Tuta absoluta]|nr:hypothetical protein O0L34_g14001 [Tuta absoluta]
MENTEVEVLLDPVEPHIYRNGHNDGRTSILLDPAESQAILYSVIDQDRAVRREPCVIWKVLNAKMHAVVQTLIGANVGVSLWFAFKSKPISAFQLHVGLCVIGYQLLMAHGVLCLRSPGWSTLGLKLRRRVHWILQLSGSILAIAGSALMIKEKSDAGRAHFTSLHAKLALAALVFTIASLINGLLSLYVVELRHLIPAKVSKISHIILGTAAFTASSASLAFGFKKHSFVEWASLELANVMVGIVIVYTGLIIVVPVYNVLRMAVSRVKIC